MVRVLISDTVQSELSAWKIPADKGTQDLHSLTTPCDKNAIYLTNFLH